MEGNRVVSSPPPATHSLSSPHLAGTGALPEQMIKIPESSLPVEVSAVGTPLPTGLSSQACWVLSWLAALSLP